MINLIELTADIVVSFVENTPIPPAQLPGLIADVHAAIGSLGKPDAPAAPEAPRRATPAQIRKSISDDFLISFIDGKPYRTLKRHIQAYGMTTCEYLTKYGLPNDYPLTAKYTSQRRQATALANGLGRKAAREPVSAKAARKSRL